MTNFVIGFGLGLVAGIVLTWLYARRIIERLRQAADRVIGKGLR